MTCHTVAHLRDYLGEMPLLENKFFRTRSGTKLRQGYTVPVSDDQGELQNGSILKRLSRHSIVLMSFSSSFRCSGFSRSRSL